MRSKMYNAISSRILASPVLLMRHQTAQHATRDVAISWSDTTLLSCLLGRDKKEDASV